MSNYEEIQNALLNYLKALRMLRELKIAPNSKDFTSQLGEWLVEQLYDGKRATSGIQKCWDVKVGNTKIQVKTHAKAASTPARWSYIKRDPTADIDELIIIVFSPEYKLKEFYKIKWSDALSLIKEGKDGGKIYWNHINKHQVDIKTLPKPDLISIFK